MQYKKFIMTASAALLICPSLLLAASLKPFKATYVVTMHGLHIGKITRQLKITNGHYEFVSDMKSTLPFTALEIYAVSTGKWLNGKPQPTNYHYQYTHFKKIKMINTHFDWQKMTATTQKHGKVETVKIPQDAQDKLSYQLLMRDDLMNHKKSLSYQITDGHSIDVYQFGKMGNEVVNAPIGKINTIKMQRTNTGPNSEDIIFWLAPQDDYAIAKIVDIEGDKTRMAGLLKSYQS